MNGEITKNAKTQVEYLLNMPRIQQALDAKFDAAGFTMDKVAEICAEIAQGTKRIRTQMLGPGGAIVELERDVSPGDRLRAVDVRVRMTSGYAPTKSVNANVTPPGRMFDPETWDETPPIETSPQSPKNVTPPRPKARRGGGSNHR